jgi:hypothetical protein
VMLKKYLILHQKKMKQHRKSSFSLFTRFKEKQEKMEKVSSASEKFIATFAIVVKSSVKKYFHSFIFLSNKTRKNVGFYIHYWGKRLGKT